MSSSQPLAPPPRTSSREPSPSGDANPYASQSLGVPGHTSDGQQETSTGLSGETAADPAESIGRGSKRSLTGRKREASTGSRRSGKARADEAEKVARQEPTSSPQSASHPRPKKKGGFLSFLNCCSTSDEGQDVGPDDTALPAKPTAKLQSSRTNRHNAGGADDSGKPNDEKVAQSNIPPSSLDPVAESEKPAFANRAAEQQASGDPPYPSVVNAATGPHTNSMAAMGSAAVAVPVLASGLSQIDTGAAAQTSALSPQVQVQAPTPIAPQAEDGIIQDRTSIQEQRDVNMEDNAVVPISTDDARKELEQEKSENQAQMSTAGGVIALPPPPPLPAQTQAGTTDGQRLSRDESRPESTTEDRKWLLPPLQQELKGRKCLVLDLDETLVHSSFKVSTPSLMIPCSPADLLQMLHQADLTIPVEIEGQYHNVYVIKRPGVDAFLKRVGELYEVVIFTASVSKYGDPLLDELDIHHVIHHRLFRESCYNHQGNYVKDLSQVGRDLRETIIIDNSPTSYIFHPQHAVPISSWFSDAHDNELLDLIPVLEDLASSQVSDVSLVLDVAL